MVTFNFRLTERGKVDYPLSTPETLEIVLQKCADGEGITLGGYIAVRSGKVITAGDLISESDVVDVFPAISGG